MIPELRQCLWARPERVIALVAHWGLLSELTGHSFDNCEVRSYELQQEGMLDMNGLS